MIWEVTTESIARYAAATKDTMALHAAGKLGPPVYAVVPAFEALSRAMTDVVPSALRRMAVHAAQDFRFHQPIVPGQRLATLAHVCGIRQASSGVIVAAQAETRDRDGELVVEQYMTSFIRGARRVTDAGRLLPLQTLPEHLRSADPSAVVQQGFDVDQTFRYAMASGDFAPVHLDDKAAQGVGFPGLIIHGLCTMAFVSRAVLELACPKDPTRLKRLAVQFSEIVVPADTITTSIYNGSHADGRDVFYLETANTAGAICVKNGRAEVSR